CQHRNRKPYMNTF
nr:immunoglobulin light chain junction region [Macaca mulatta]